MNNLKEEWIKDLKEKIQFINDHLPTIGSYLFPEEEKDKEKINKIKNNPNSSYNWHIKHYKEEIIYLNEMIKKVKKLKQNPKTIEEKELWLEIMNGLNSDFHFNHDSRNEDMGWAGKILLSYIFDINEELEKTNVSI